MAAGHRVTACAGGASPYPTSAKLHGLRLLVVDDVPANAIALAQMLDLLGAQVATAFTSDDAIQLASSERFDLFICDLVMPGVDGYRMLAALRASAMNAGTPAIAHTGHNDPDVHAAAVAAGYQRVLTKPSGIDDFVQAIRSLCGR